LLLANGSSSQAITEIQRVAKQLCVMLP